MATPLRCWMCFCDSKLGPSLISSGGSSWDTCKPFFRAFLQKLAVQAP